MTAQQTAPATAQAAPEATGPAPWWHSPFRTFQTNLREIDAGMDVDAALDAIEEYGADTWLLSVGGIIANHPSRLASQTVSPHLAERPSGDLVGDATRAAQARGIRVLARMDFSKIDAARAERHPEWCFVSPDGAPQIYNGYRRTYAPAVSTTSARCSTSWPRCWRSTRLPGSSSNWMSAFNEVDYSSRYRGVCHCESCRHGFARFAPELPLPAGPEDADYTELEGILERGAGRPPQADAGAPALARPPGRAHPRQLAPRGHHLP